MAQAKKQARRGTQAAEAGDKPETDGDEDEEEELPANAAPDIALD